ncbi:unnamed protein product [Linum trigynum]|uniref:Pentatricopeptide repeat-containing protein n=1 Tax=Linum trigynum TaxID=586398 RepID=A0AAV2FK61_9ROSI
MGARQLPRRLLPILSSPTPINKFPPTFSSFSSPFCSLSPPRQAEDQERHELVGKLLGLLQEGGESAAYQFTKSLVLSKSRFSSPSDLLSFISVASPSLRPTLSHMLLAISCESKMEGLGYRERRDLSPFLTARECMGTLVEMKQFEKVLALVAETMELGFRLDTFMYGKAVQAAVKSGDLKKGTELFESMKSCGVRPNVFVFNVLIGGLCKERRIRDAEKKCASGTWLLIK